MKRKKSTLPETKSTSEVATIAKPVETYAPPSIMYRPDLSRSESFAGRMIIWILILLFLFATIACTGLAIYYGIFHRKDYTKHSVDDVIRTCDAPEPQIRCRRRSCTTTYYQRCQYTIPSYDYLTFTERDHLTSMSDAKETDDETISLDVYHPPDDRTRATTQRFKGHMQRVLTIVFSAVAFLCLLVCIIAFLLRNSKFAQENAIGAFIWRLIFSF